MRNSPSSTMPKQHTRRTVAADSNDQEDHLRSFEDWGRLTTSARLAEKALIHHFHPEHVVATDQPERPDHTISSSDILTELKAIRSEITLMKSPNQHSSSRRTNPLHFEPLQPIHRRPDVGPIPCVSYTGADTDQTMLADIIVGGNKHTPQLMTGPIPATNSQGNTLSLFSNPTTTNPYTPPPIKTKLLERMKNLEYIEFDELRSPPPSINTDNFFGLQIDEAHNVLLKPHKPKAKIQNFTDWLCSWNLFFQGTLCYHLQLHFDLFCYFKIITNLARKYKFDHVYCYDQAQRTLLASQKNVPTTQQAASWGVINEEFYNMFLRDAHLPACYPL